MLNPIGTSKLGAFRCSPLGARGQQATMPGQWLPFGSGFAGRANALTRWQGTLVAGGWIPAHDTGNHLRHWDGQQWAVMPGRFDDEVDALLADHDSSALFAGGRFRTIDGQIVNYLSSWDGSQWRVWYRNGLNGTIGYGRVYGFAQHQGGGLPILASESTGGPAGNNPKWLIDIGDRELFAPMYAAVNSTGTVMDVLEGLGPTFVARSDDVFRYRPEGYRISAYAGGPPPGAPNAYICHPVAGCPWILLGGQWTSPRKLANWRRQLAVAGQGREQAEGPIRNHVRLNRHPQAATVQEADQAWVTLGDPMDGEIRALLVWDDKLIAGGAFRHIGHTRVNGVAWWDESANAWRPFDTGLHTDNDEDGSSVNALFDLDGTLVAAGWFNQGSGKEIFSIGYWSVPAR